MDAVLDIQPECSLNKFLKNVDEMGMYYQRNFMCMSGLPAPYKVMMSSDRRKKLEKSATHLHEHLELDKDYGNTRKKRPWIL